MASTKPAVGMIGLGIMGGPMARNLLLAGYPLTVYHPRPEAVATIVQAGAVAADSPRDVAAGVDVLVTMLPDSAEVEQVYLGEGGAFEALRPGWLAIDMSSIAPAVARELSSRAARAGAEMLDAPVSGGDQGAIAGTLSIMVGGSGAGFERAMPLLGVLGRTIVHVGPAGSGQVAKVCNQIVVAVVIEAVSEALVLGTKTGLDPARLADVLQGGLGSTRVLDVRRDNFLNGSFDPGFRVRLHLKDLKNALELGRQAGVVLPAASLVHQLMLSLDVAGKGDLDHSSLLTVLEQLAGTAVSAFDRNAGPA